MHEHVCPPGLSILLINPFRRIAHKPKKILEKFIRRGDTVLDIGCGPGFFTVAMAELVGEGGLVIAADIHEKMLEKTGGRAARADVLSRVRLHLNRKDKLGIGDKVDFAMAFWVVHEVKNHENFFGEIRDLLKPDAVFLMVEPKLHVSADRFKEIVDVAVSTGLNFCGEEKIALSRSAVFKKQPRP